MLLEKPWLATTPFQGAVLVRKVSDAAADLSGGEGRGSLSGFETCDNGEVSRGSKGCLIVDSELPCRAACYMQLAQHSCYNIFIDTDGGADMTGSQGNTSGDMPRETSKPVGTMSGGMCRRPPCSSRSTT